MYNDCIMNDIQFNTEIDWYKACQNTLNHEMNVYGAFFDDRSINRFYKDEIENE